MTCTLDTLRNARRVQISVSGGRTSLAMAHLLTRALPASIERVLVFANTGLEHPATLDFMRDAEVWLGEEIHWIEAAFGPRGVGVRARRVDYDTASRDGEPFRALVEKHAIPGPGRPWCTGRLKSRPLQSYMRHCLGWESWHTAIGIRADEIDRVSVRHREDRIVYPLIDLGMTHDDVREYLDRHEAPELRLPGSHYGNCVTCWKKSRRKLLTIARDAPSWFRPFAEMEQAAERAGKQGTFFRDHATVADILREAATTQFRPYVDQPDQRSLLVIDDLDLGGGCGESCEAHADEEADP